MKLINNKIAKPSSEVKVGDTIEIQFGNNNVKVEVVSVSETVQKNDAKGMYVEKSDWKSLFFMSGKLCCI